MLSILLQLRYLIGITVVGFIVRASLFLSGDFPINDGGLFYMMGQEVLDHSFRLPWFTSYNNLDIPYVYPPLAFFVMALLHLSTAWPMEAFLMFVPLVLSTLTIPLTFILGRTLGYSRSIALVAACGMAVIPQSYAWFIMGGGITRSLGLVFTLVTLISAWSKQLQDSARLRAIPGLLLGLVILTHPGGALFTCVSLFLYWIIHQRSRFSFIKLLWTYLVALVVSLPWWLTVFSRHGFSPMIDAYSTGGWSASQYIQILFVNFTREPFLPVFALLSILGVWVCVVRRTYFLVVWLMVIWAIDPRNNLSFGQVVVSFLAAIGASEVVTPPIVALYSAIAQKSHRVVTLLVSGLLCTLYLLSNVLGLIAVDTLFPILSAGQREAMSWVREHTSTDARFLIPPRPGDGQYWSNDDVAEWFPALAHRESVLTVQGREWLPNRNFQRFRLLYQDVRICDSNYFCIEDTLRSASVSFEYIVLPKLPLISTARIASFSALAAQLETHAQWSLVYENEGMMIWQRK